MVYRCRSKKCGWTKPVGRGAPRKKCPVCGKTVEKVSADRIKAPVAE